MHVCSHAVKLLPVALLVAVGVGSCAGHGSRGGRGEGSRANEATIVLADAPAGVRAAIAKLTAPGNVQKVIREMDEGITTYEVEYVENGVACAAILSGDGDVMETERAVPQGSLPAAAWAALMKDFPGATFADPQVVTRTFYEVVVTKHGKTHEVKVDPAGNIEDTVERGDDAHEN